MSILALGDSLTCGHLVSKTKSWPQQVFTEKIDVIAQNGWTAKQLLMALQKHKFTCSYGLVTLQTGVNDHFAKSSCESFAQELGDIIECLYDPVLSVTTPLLVISIPDWTLSPYAQESMTSDARQKLSSLIDDFNSTIQQTIANFGKKIRVDYIDITALSRLEPQLVVPQDRLHPSAEMYHLWARKIYPIAHRHLEKFTEEVEA